ncbi:MAG: tripartite tricarboxylate transporter substrate binding protein [Betaproteobacteria bacterium]|nr:tripartite tricarboxylate transporter substrate binding protein [Betaproteobacteria bacterium]
MRLARWHALLAAGALLACAPAGPAFAAEPYPVHAARVVVPYPPGGPTDIIARYVAVRLTEALGQQFMVDNRGGANGVIGTDAVARARPDCYTLLISASWPLASGLALYKNVPYDVLRDFAPVTPVASADVVLVASQQFAPRTLAEIIAAAKAKPLSVRAELNSVGSMHHLLTELLRVRAGIEMLTVPYKGSGPAIIDLVAGHVDVGFESLPGVIELIRSNRLRAIAVAGARRAETLPEIPTFIELGMAEFVAEPWFAMLAPKGTPPDVIEKLSGTLDTILRIPEVKAQFAKQGMAPVWMTPEDTGRFLGTEITRWATIVKETGAKND